MEQTRKTEHFKVPEGYFENFTKQMMAQLPEQVDMPVRKKTISVLWSRVAVSIAVVLAFTATWYALESYNLYEEMADAGNGICRLGSARRCRRKGQYHPPVHLL